MKPVAFLDLGGVLVDFVGGALARFGRADFPVSSVRWEIDQQLGISLSEFWSKLDFDFWANLDWTTEGRALLAEVEDRFGDDVVVMTSPCETAGCVDGKIAWLRRHMPRYRRRYFVGPPKASVAGPGKVLVDDHQPNAEGFADKGGWGVLVPRPWNDRRDECCGAGGFDVGAIAAELDEFLRNVSAAFESSEASREKPETKC